MDRQVRGHATDTGSMIWDFDTAPAFATANGVPATEGSLNGPGPTVAGGMLFVNSGYTNLGFMPGDVLAELRQADDLPKASSPKPRARVWDQG